MTDSNRRQFLTILTGAVAAAAAGGAAFGFLRGEVGVSEPQAGTTATVRGASTTDTPTTTEAATTTDATTAETSTTTEPTTTTAPGLVVPVICREAWGANPAGSDLVAHTLDRLTVHHTATPITDASGAPAHFRGHQAYHQGNLGWADIAYHFLIDPNGNVYEGRDVAFAADTATEYDPAGHFTVVIDGNFSESAINDAQLSACADVLAHGASAHGIDPATLAGHRDYAATACPGDTAYAPIADGTLEAMVRERLAGGPVGIRLVCGTDGDALVSDIEAGLA